MPVRVRCTNPECHHVFNVEEKLLGRRPRCTACGQAFLLPSPAATLGTDASATPATSPSPPVPSPDLPARVGRFQIRALLGSGAFGHVYRAYDPQLDREVAIKVPRPGILDSPKRVERFLREARAAARLRHTHIVPVYEIGQEGEQHYIVTAFIAGQSLAAAIDEKGLECCRAARIVRALAEAMAYAHEQRTIHRDIKPANVMLDGKDQPLLMDFGLASRLEGSEKLTQTGTILGTPSYMAPEQAKGQEGDPQPASDQYSLGVMLYELLTGRTPFAGPPAVVLLNALTVEPEPPRKLRSEVPVELEGICLKAMAKKSEERYTDCQALADALGGWLESTRPGQVSGELASDRRATEVCASIFKEESHKKPAVTATERGPRPGLRLANKETWTWARQRWVLVAAIGSVALVVLLGIILVIAGGRSEGPRAEVGSGARSTSNSRSVSSGKTMPGPGTTAQVQPPGTTPSSPPFSDTRPGVSVPSPGREPRELTVQLAENVSLDLVLIKPGSFVMGDDSGEKGDGPAHRVTITRPFYLGKYEVTQEQWEAAMGSNPSQFKGPKNPVEMVSWDDCQAFLKKLNEKIGKTTGTFRLPTEAEWEYACRGGTTTKYSFGDAESGLGDYGWFGVNSSKTTHPVGQKKPNAWGYYDMHGNVHEWCQDWQGAYPNSDQVDPPGPAQGSVRVIRGGSWCGDPRVYQSASRSKFKPGDRHGTLGLRLALIPSEEVASPGTSPKSQTREAITNSLEMKFTWIPPGSFQMGSPPGEEGRNINETRHRVTLTKGFYLGIYEVTRGQYAGFVKATGYQTIAERKRGADFWTAAGWQSGPKVNWQAPGFEQTDNHPVVCLGWSDAIAFADWVSTQDRAGRRYRLPTEAEWEYACRAGEPSAYCSGNTPEALKKVGWCSYDKEGSAGGTKSVGQFQPNAWGLYDMHGNAWEWCQDWFEEYSRSDQNEPAGPVRGSYRVFRGGCWLSAPRECRSAMRGFRDPEDRGNHLGCRLVMVPAG